MQRSIDNRLVKMDQSATILLGKTDGVDTPLAAELRKGDGCDNIKLQQLLSDGAASTVSLMRTFYNEDITRTCFRCKFANLFLFVLVPFFKTNF